jgi:protocatechuate 3,4-dioxygenase beta subunit
MTHEHDRGLDYDLPKIVERNRLGRRGLLGIGAGVGLVALTGCGDDSTSDAVSSSDPVDRGAPSGAPPAGGPGGDSTVEVAEGEIPEETAGPYPGDGSNGPNVLTESGIVRSDITTSFGSASGVAEGVPTTVRLRVYDLSGDDITPLSGGAVYLWHCDREGRYSMYSDGITEENYLRGVQEADKDGWVEFTTIFPACYSGRWPHIHFEVFPSVGEATSGNNAIATSQLALPKDISDDVYDNVDGYEESVTNLSQLSLDTDGIFSDGYSLQLAKVTGSVDEGYSLTLNVPV